MWCKLVLLLAKVVIPAHSHPSPSPSRHFRNHTCHHFSHLHYLSLLATLVTTCYCFSHFSLLATTSHNCNTCNTCHCFSPLVTTCHHLSMCVNPHVTASVNAQPLLSLCNLLSQRHALLPFLLSPLRWAMHSYFFSLNVHCYCLSVLAGVYTRAYLLLPFS